MEDKLVQGITKRVLDQIYELEFLGFSYGFRPGRGAHRALDALTIAIERKKVSWVLDADIRGFFDAIDHDCLMTMIERRIGAQRVLRHIKKWLNAGVLEDGKKTQRSMGRRKGGAPALSWPTSTSTTPSTYGLRNGDVRRRAAKSPSCVTRTTVRHDGVKGNQRWQPEAALLHER